MARNLHWLFTDILQDLFLTMNDTDMVRSLGAMETSILENLSTTR
jgi:hypothetical protein